MNQAEDELNLSGPSIFRLKFGTFFKKKLPFMTRIPQPPSLEFKSLI